MSLWTPYVVAEAPLDLSKPTVKQEPAPVATQEYYQHSGYETTYQPYFGYQYQHYAAPAQFSPLSGGSSCSAFEVVPTTLTSVFPVRPVPLSPPESPDSVTVKPSAAGNLSVLLSDADTLSDDPDFQSFERDALSAMAEKNGGSLVGNNPRMRRAVKSTSQDAGDDTYRKQRERNNFAAKQSRDRRKLREIHLALKVAYLKNEVANLKAMVSLKTCVRCHRKSDC